MENPIQMDDLGIHLFLETSIWLECFSPANKMMDWYFSGRKKGGRILETLVLSFENYRMGQSKWTPVWVFPKIVVPSNHPFLW